MKNKINTIQSPFGEIRLETQDNFVISVSIEKTNSPTKKASQAVIELLNNATDVKFDVSHGTEFQQKVWKAIQKIKVGKTKTYSELASSIGHPKAYRAVANACGQNKIALLIPCHRVVGINNLGGYAWGEDTKAKILEIEKAL